MEKHFYEQLKIENFRGIKSLEINDLARINLFVGRNNCGKTSVLEAAFLLIGMSRPGLLLSIENRRGLAFTESSYLKNFFYDQEHNEGFRLSGRQSMESRELNVVPVYGDFDVGQVASALSNDGDTIRDGDPIELAIFSTETEQSLIGLKFKFVLWNHVNKKDQKDYQHEATIRFAKSKSGDPELHLEEDKEYEEAAQARFLQHNSYYSNSVDRMLNEKGVVA